MKAREPGQVRKEAALSGHLQARRGSRIGVIQSDRAASRHHRGGCTIHLICGALAAASGAGARERFGRRRAERFGRRRDARGHDALRLLRELARRCSRLPHDQAGGQIEPLIQRAPPDRRASRSAAARRSRPSRTAAAGSLSGEGRPSARSSGRRNRLRRDPPGSVSRAGVQPRIRPAPAGRCRRRSLWEASAASAAPPRHGDHRRRGNRRLAATPGRSQSQRAPAPTGSRRPERSSRACPQGR